MWSRELGAEYCAGMKQVSPGEGLPVEGAGREGSSEEVTLQLYLLQTIFTFCQLDALLLQAKALRVLQHLNSASCTPCHPCPHRGPSRAHYCVCVCVCVCVCFTASQGLCDLSSWTRD